jgi:hypothetical protein
MAQGSYTALQNPSCPDLILASTERPTGAGDEAKAWMAGTGPGVTRKKVRVKA